MVAKSCDADYATNESWVRKYQANGIDGLKDNIILNK